MADDERRVEPSIYFDPVSDTPRRKMVCPECNHLLPVDVITECDRCGAHLRLELVVDVPSVDDHG